MASVGLSRSLVASLPLIICMHAFYQNIHAMENHIMSAPSSSVTSPSTRILRVGVPWKTGFTEFVSVQKNGTNVSVGGFCVKVFEEAMKTLNYSIHYIPVGDGHAEPNYSNVLIGKILRKEVDAVVGDVTITANRAQQVVFTQPFIDSGLTAVVKLKEDEISYGFAFLKPFTAGMWVLTLGFFITGGLAIYLSERKQHPQFNRSKQCGSIFWFVFSILFTNQNDTKTVLARIVVVAWLFVTGILYSCYTANLSAILTAPRLEPTFTDADTVLAKQNIKIGFQMGSYVGNYLADNFRIDRRRLIPLNTEADYHKALFSGEVEAIVEERPYMQSLVTSNCNKLTFAGETFTTQNWGFAFDHIHDQLAKEISIRILKLADSGTLNTIEKQMLPSYDKDCSGYNQFQIQVYNFWGLFVGAGLVSVIVLLLSMLRWKRDACGLPTHSIRQGSSGHGGGLQGIKSFQWPRRTISFNPRPRRVNVHRLSSFSSV